MPPPTKRRRVDGEAAPPSQSAIRATQAKVDALPLATIQQLLKDAIRSNPELMVDVDRAHDDMVRRAKATVINFDSYSKHAWKLLNTRHARSSGSRQYEAAFEVANEIGELFQKMLDKASDDLASYGTRRSAAVTMRKIFKSTLLANDTLGRYVRQNCYGWDETFATLISDAFDEEELETLAADVEKDETFVDKVRELVELAEGDPTFGRLNDVLEMLEGSGENEEASEEESEEEAEEEVDEEAENEALDEQAFEEYGWDGPQASDEDSQTEDVDAYHRWLAKENPEVAPMLNRGPYATPAPGRW